MRRLVCSACRPVPCKNGGLGLRIVVVLVVMLMIEVASAGTDVREAIIARQVLAGGHRPLPKRPRVKRHNIGPSAIGRLEL